MTCQIVEWDNGNFCLLVMLVHWLVSRVIGWSFGLLVWSVGQSVGLLTVIG